MKNGGEIGNCYKLTENALKMYQQLHKVRVNSYHQPGWIRVEFVFLKKTTFFQNCFCCDFKKYSDKDNSIYFLKRQ
jgi:hypothetical protein